MAKIKLTYKAINTYENNGVVEKVSVYAENEQGVVYTMNLNKNSYDQKAKKYVADTAQSEKFDKAYKEISSLTNGFTEDTEFEAYNNYEQYFSLNENVTYNYIPENTKDYKNFKEFTAVLKEDKSGKYFEFDIDGKKGKARTFDDKTSLKTTRAIKTEQGFEEVTDYRKLSMAQAVERIMGLELNKTYKMGIRIDKFNEFFYYVIDKESVELA